MRLKQLSSSSSNSNICKVYGNHKSNPIRYTEKERKKSITLNEIIKLQTKKQKEENNHRNKCKTSNKMAISVYISVTVN